MNFPDSQSRPEQAVALHKGSDFTQLSLWMGATLAGMMTAAILARGPFFEKMLANLGRGRRSSKKPTEPQSLPMLAGAIIGSSKSTIESVFGPPRSAAVNEIGIVVHPQQVFWQSDVWYYALTRHSATAIAIRFEDDFASHVEFFTAPQLN